MTMFLKTCGRLGGILALILLIVTLLRQLIGFVGFLLAAVKLAIILIFAALMVMIALAILNDRARRRKEVEDL